MVTKNKKKQRRIWVTDEITAQLKSEFDLTGVTVLNALKFYSFSENAQKIRSRALELMDEVQMTNKVLFQENNQ
jgi:hypothetical protein